MQAKTKQVLGIVLTFVIAMSMVACASGGSGSTAPTQSVASTSSSASANTASTEAEPTNLSIIWWGNDERNASTMKVLDLYTKETGVTFSPEYTNWDGYWQKLPVLSASNTLPDVIQMDSAYMNNYISNKQLSNLNDMDLSGIIDNAVLNNMKYDGVLYGVPLSRNGAALLYNKTVLEQYGVDLPKEGWTWTEYIAFCEDARTKLPADIYVCQDEASRECYEYQYYQMGFGKGMLFDDAGTLNLDKELWYEFMNIYLGFREKKIVPPAADSVAHVENDPQTDILATGKVVLRHGSAAAAGAVLSSLPPNTELGVVNKPLGPDGGGWAQSTIFFSVCEYSSKQQESRDFIKWFASDLDAGVISALYRGLPISDEVFGKLEPNLTEVERFNKSFYEVAARNKPMPFAGYLPTSKVNFLQEYRDIMESVLFGSMTLDQAYDAVVKAGS